MIQTNITPNVPVIVMYNQKYKRDTYKFGPVTCILIQLVHGLANSNWQYVKVANDINDVAVRMKTKSDRYLRIVHFLY